MKWIKLKKIKTIPQETLDNARKIDSSYQVVDVIKNGENKLEELKEEDVIRKEDIKQEEINKKIDLHPKDPIISQIEPKKEMIEKNAQTEENLVLKPDTQGIMRLTEKALGTSENTQQIIFRDASSVIAEKLPEQLGSDPIDISKGKYDVRRLTNINELERVWIGYFNLLDPFEGGDWAKQYANEYMNLSMAIHGERAKLLVKMQMAASGGSNSPFKKPDDKRNFIERHFTKRGQEPKEDDMNEL